MDEDPNKKAEEAGKDKGKRIASEAAPASEMDSKKPRPVLESSSVDDNFQQVNEADAAAAAAAGESVAETDDPEEQEVQSSEQRKTHVAGISSSKEEQGDDDKDKDNKGRDK